MPGLLGTPSVRAPLPACDEQAIGVAVIAADAFDDHVASGGGSGEADGAHGRFGAAVDETDHLHGGEAEVIDGGESDFAIRWGRRSWCRADGLGEGGDDALVGVAGDERAVAGDIVDVLVAVDVDNVAALAFFNEERGSADGLERADGGGDAAGHELSGFGESRFGISDGATGLFCGHGELLP